MDEPVKISAAVSASQRAVMSNHHDRCYLLGLVVNVSKFKLCTMPPLVLIGEFSCGVTCVTFLMNYSLPVGR